MDKINILIVDDKKENIYALKELLSSDDMRIFEALSGEACLEVLLNEQIDIILMDIQMPTMDGFETAKFIRNNDKTKDIPILYITAANRNEKINIEGYQRGAIDVIYKPINKDILKIKIGLFKEMIKTRKQLEQKVQLLTELNNQNVKMRKEIEKLALYDYLTQISNRRKIDQDFIQLYKDAHRNKKPISIMMLDIDNFKGYNDYYGHGEGDIVLQKVASAIDKTLRRPLDTVGRYGGEEFLVVLHNTDLEGAKNIANQILENIRALKIVHCPYCNFDFVTLSIGIATKIPDNANDYLLFLKESDKALYDAKNAGKNQFKYKT